MMELRASNWEDKEYDSCGNTTVAALEINSMTIPLCMYCVEELIQHVDVFKNTIFCYQCNNFIHSENGWKYGGSCKLKALKDGKEITSKDAGYSYCVDCMDTCKDAMQCSKE